MKAIQLFMLVAIAPISAFASEANDTVAVIEKPTSVTVINKENGKTIVIEGRKNDPDYKLVYESAVKDDAENDVEQLWVFNPRFTRQAQKNQKKRKAANPSTDAICDIYAGAVIPSEGDPGISRTGWEIGMLNVGKINWRLSNFGTNLSLGIGWQYRHFTIGDELMARRSDNGAYVLSPIPSEYHNVKSSLKNFSIQFPLALSQKLCGDFAIEVGGVAMLNTYTTGNCSWSENGTETKRSIKHLHQRILTVDALARIGWKGILAFYMRYSPMSLFSRQYGPQYESVAIGGSLGF